MRVDPSLDDIPAYAGPSLDDILPIVDPSRVRMNRKSLVVSALFGLNLLLMPFKPYLSEATPFRGATHRLLTVEAAETINQTEHMEYFRTRFSVSTLPLGATYVYDAATGTDVARHAFPLNRSVQADCAHAIITSVAGALYFPLAHVTDISHVLCGFNATASTAYAKVWKHTMLSTPHALSVLWTVPGNDLLPPPKKSDQVDSFTIYSLYASSDYTTSWRLLKLFCRLFLSVYIGYVCYAEYYTHVVHLRKALMSYVMSERKNVVRYEILVGDATCIVLSHPKICFLFVLDFWMSPELSGQAAMRVEQFESAYYFALGSMYFSRSVWLSYSTLVLLNPLLRRARKSHWLKPANPTLLAIAAYAYSGFFTHLQLAWYPMLSVYIALFSMMITPAPPGDEFVEAIAAFLGFSLSLCTLPVLLGVPGIAARAAKRAVRNVRQVSNGRDATRWYRFHAHDGADMNEGAFAYNDFKHKSLLWFYRLGSNIQDVMHGGSMYRLFEAYPEYRRHGTMDQRGGDCYVLGYTRTNKLVEVTRVSLVSQMDAPLYVRKTAKHHDGGRKRSLSKTPRNFRYAVGTLVVHRTGAPGAMVSVTKGAKDSPWVA
ncbi:hypothetical protein SDRG_03006 [Saprolegnia diclina VS20]|uniref:Uncharacterized protein n=1 Tax=Saprolegnia diclina (strain VS20) TaxID=1156394 RepID=T0S9X0_SAPDV|nr:hypothetical protein SDRG_03006 [Saprolegnia diclina VS20]EQC39572.1 hypothetical protein SDRG_03006 [Saprolegnia diclina VS20]|eukprot:XP_008606844.1 hypothetical protein SDRG_03006 [Saprolegnia diclina VS20]